MSAKRQIESNVRSKLRASDRDARPSRAQGKLSDARSAEASADESDFEGNNQADATVHSGQSVIGRVIELLSGDATYASDDSGRVSRYGL